MNGFPKMQDEITTNNQAEVLKYDINKKIIDDGLIKEIKNDEILSSGTLELRLDKEDNDIEYKQTDIENSNRKVKPITQLFLNEYKSIIEKKDKLEKFETNSLNKKVHLGSGDQLNFDTHENFEEIEEKELKNEKILKRTPFNLLERNNKITKQLTVETENFNFINAGDNCSVIDKNANSETKAIQIICRKDDILTVLLDRKKQKNDNASSSQLSTIRNNWKLKKKFSMFTSKKASQNFTDHEVKFMQ